MTVIVVNVGSDDEDYTQLRKVPRRHHAVRRTVRAPKIRHPASPAYEADGSELNETDEDYLHLLNLQNSSDSDVSSLKEEEGVNHLGDGISDPHYNIFLENLKLEGKSYVLQINLEDSTELLKYECEEMPCPFFNGKAFGNMWDNLNRERLHGTCISQETRNGRSNAADMFWNKDGEKQSNKRKKSSKKESGHIQRKVKVKQRKGVLQRRNVKVEEITTSTKMKRYHGKKVRKSTRLRDMRDWDEDSLAWEQNTLEFVQCLRKDGDFVVRTFDAGTTMRYGEYKEEDGESDIEIIAREDISSIGVNNPFVSAHSTDVVNLERMEGGKNPSSNDSEFRINLLKKLKEPYDMEEYEDLIKLVTYKRRKEVDKELRRGRGLSYSVKNVCKSYLDNYKDFAKVLKRAKGDRRRTLNLLRGFKYWLHNMPKGGSFYPWLDSHCLSLLPGP